MIFGDNLKKLRKSSGLSQEELAEKVKVSRQSVSKWETGEAYPEMNNILELCKIFKCKNNDLLNYSILDLESLHEEVKMSVVKFEKEKQKKMKGLSKAIAVISKICKVIVTIAIAIIICVAIMIPFLINRIDITDNELTFKGSKEKIDLVLENSNLILKYNNEEIDDEEFSLIVAKYKELVDKHSKTVLIVYVELIFICLIISLVIIREILKHLQELFVNINKGDTPFTLVNVKHIKMMAYLMIVSIVFPNVTGAIFEHMISANLNIGFDLLDIIEILFLFSMAYIFEYGYQLQLDSKGKMYGDENE